MASEQLRVGIAGTGFIGSVHARSARLAGARVVSVAASSPESAEAAAVALRADRAAASAEELVQDPDLDVVHICTPNHLHQPLAAAALAAGKHVVCEKPLAMDAAGAEQLVAAAAAADRQAAVPFVYRFYPTVREARERVRSGETGTRAARARDLSPGLAPAPRGRELARGRDPRRRVARLRRHRLALVRPRGVRDRPAAHPALGPDAHDRAGAAQRLGQTCLRRRRRHAASCGR